MAGVTHYEPGCMMTVHSKKIIEKITKGLQSKYPLLYVLGWDENRIENLLIDVAGSSFPLITWTASEGFEKEAGIVCENDTDPLQALTAVSQAEGPVIFLLKDLPVYLESSHGLVRSLRDLYYKLKGKGVYVFISHPILKLPEILKKEIFLIEMPLPSEEEILQVMKEYIVDSELPAEPDRELLHYLAVAMKGLSLNEVGHLQTRLFSNESLELETAIAEIQEEKSQILRKESCLRFYPPQRSLDDIGGLDNLKDWVVARQGLFTERAFQAGIPLPSGILFMGVSGCGKSMAAKAIAAAWSLPLVRLDMSLVLSGTYGSPEYAFEHATKVAEEIAPIVLWIDEVENSFGYDEQSGTGGNINIFSSFLTWMQEKPSNVFLAATANRIQQLPAELMRKGRFDQLFFLDLPTKEEREEIFSIHIALNGGLTSQFDVAYLAAATKQWSGAEIEQAIKSARVDAYQEGRRFDERDVLQNTVNMVPLSKTMEEQIQAIKDWSFQRAVPASGKST